MKINRIIFFLFVGVILSGLMMGAFILGVEKRAVTERIDQNQAPTNDSYVAASISEGTILLLLAVGVVGALGLSRKKKDSGSDLRRSPADRAGQDVSLKEDRKKITSQNS